MAEGEVHQQAHHIVNAAAFGQQADLALWIEQVVMASQQHDQWQHQQAQHVQRQLHSKKDGRQNDQKLCRTFANHRLPSHINRHGQAWPV